MTRTPPTERLERIEAWGMSSSSLSYVYRPTTEEGIIDAFEDAEAFGLPVALKGGGNSYGDAFQCPEGIVIDLTRMTRILEWSHQTGIIRCEPGVTIEQLWQYTLPDGWWPPVVPGTAKVTIGGAVAANIHGKNCFAVGPIGDHVLEFELLTPTRDKIHCSRTENSDIFYAAIGGFGLLGVIFSITLQMKRVHSGLLKVEPVSVASWREQFSAFERLTGGGQADYVVGWVDAFSSGASSGRGLVHGAWHLGPGEDAHPEETLRASAQALPDTFAGCLARSQLFRFMRPFVNRFGMRMVNAAKFRSGKRESGRIHRESLARFSFLLDAAPNWKLSYGKAALVQYQAFLPIERAPEAFDRIVGLSQDRGMVPLLAVLKKHRQDSFLLSHGLDGYSLALDYRVPPKARDAMNSLARALDEIVLENRGRFYFAKDSTLFLGAPAAVWGEDALAEFLAIKRRLDPESVLQSALFTRVFGTVAPPSVSAPAEERPQDWDQPSTVGADEDEVGPPPWALPGESEGKPG